LFVVVDILPFYSGSLRYLALTPLGGAPMPTFEVEVSYEGRWWNDHRS